MLTTCWPAGERSPTICSGLISECPRRASSSRARPVASERRLKPLGLYEWAGNNEGNCGEDTTHVCEDVAEFMAHLAVKNG